MQFKKQLWKPIVVIMLLVNPAAFIAYPTAKVARDENKMKENPTANNATLEEKTTVMNQVANSLQAGNTQLTSQQQSSPYNPAPFFTPHVFTGIDNDFSDDKAFFITKEGTYFPRAYVSKMRFYVQYAEFIKARFIPVNEVTARWLSVYTGTSPDNMVLEKRVKIRPNQENFISIDFGVSYTNLFVEFQIYRGDYADKAWMLEWVYFKNDTSNSPIQFFPRAYRAKIETQFIGGPDTSLSFSVLQYYDISNRFVSVYVDGTLVMPETATAGGQLTISNLNIGSYAERSVHNLTIQIRSGNYADFGWQLTDLEIGYRNLHVEVDWMRGYQPPLDIFDSMAGYFRKNGYEWVEFHTNSAPLDLDQKYDSMDTSELKEVYNDHSWTKVLYPDNHRYLLFGKYSFDGSLGFGVISNDGSLDGNGNFSVFPYAFVAVQAIKDLRKNLLWKFFTNDRDNIYATAMHELGHTLGLNKILNDTSQGTTSEYSEWGNREYSVMYYLTIQNSPADKYYSRFWWMGDGRWWDLRLIKKFDYSITIKPESEVVVFV